MVEMPLTGKRLLLTVLRFLIFADLFVFTLSAQIGNISGTVTDSSRRVLVGAQVQVEGQPRSTSSDESGKYTFLGVPAGPTKVKVSYLGFGASNLETTVTAGATSTLDFVLGVASVSAELTVSAAPDLVGQQQALNDQKSSI